ncbi:hypothetical protein [Anaplasma phagocytophilum]|uniref:hypothetical protein n=1 Tax=Anaplasma phagocytophilum TaxID=948 RepID=UPI001650F48D|nr:hypothetical protein [Anaplasma phagocytophilum]
MMSKGNSVLQASKPFFRADDAFTLEWLIHIITGRSDRYTTQYHPYVTSFI